MNYHTRNSFNTSRAGAVVNNSQELLDSVSFAASSLQDTPAGDEVSMTTRKSQGERPDGPADRPSLEGSESAPLVGQRDGTGDALTDSLLSSRARSAPGSSPSIARSLSEKARSSLGDMQRAISKYIKFIGPGILVSVSYMDPGNYSTAVSAGSMYQYKLLFAILVSNLFAAFLQTLCAKLGSVTGLDLAQNCRRHLPKRVSLTIYILAEIAIIATDLAEVVGTAIALNILFGINLSVGVAITIVDVILVLMAYRPNGPMRAVRYFEYMVTVLVAVVVICFAILLVSIGPMDTDDIFRGFLPSKELTETKGLYLACGILGATVMPHSLYLGSGLVQPRLKEYDIKHGIYDESIDSASASNLDNDDSDDEHTYKPSIRAINYAMNFTIVELVISLFTVAIFVNCAILIVAGATLSSDKNGDQTGGEVDADLFSIYEMLKSYLGQMAATVFALALLFSGQSAGIVCTLSGQMVSEGFLKWSLQPWVRRLITRGLAIAPCFFVSAFVGRKGLAVVLNASQVVLSLLLPFVTAPLLYFTASKSIMSVKAIDSVDTMSMPSSPLGDSSYQSDDLDVSPPKVVDLSNSRLTNVTAVLIFLLVSGLNFFLLISMALGREVPI